MITSTPIYFEDLTTTQMQEGIAFAQLQQLEFKEGGRIQEVEYRNKIQRLFNRAICGLSRLQQENLAKQYHEKQNNAVSQLFDRSIIVREQAARYCDSAAAREQSARYCDSTTIDQGSMGIQRQKMREEIEDLQLSRTKIAERIAKLEKEAPRIVEKLSREDLSGYPIHYKQVVEGFNALVKQGNLHLLKEEKDIREVGPNIYSLVRNLTAEELLSSEIYDDFLNILRTLADRDLNSLLLYSLRKEKEYFDTEIQSRCENIQKQNAYRANLTYPIARGDFSFLSRSYSRKCIEAFAILEPANLGSPVNATEASFKDKAFRLLGARHPAVFIEDDVLDDMQCIFEKGWDEFYFSNIVSYLGVFDAMDWAKGLPLLPLK